MIGGAPVITAYHRAAAALALPAVIVALEKSGGTIGVSVAGESGAGKSGLAACLAERLRAVGRAAVVLGQDDYFRLPPRSNHERREADLSRVGTGEVRLDLMDEHVAALKSNPRATIRKPLVHFDENRITEESLEGEGCDVVIAEGTYTTALESVDVRILIDRTYRQTRTGRRMRGRDPDVAFLERALEIEHAIISAHRARADVIVD